MKAVMNKRSTGKSKQRVSRRKWNSQIKNFVNGTSSWDESWYPKNIVNSNKN